MATKSAETPYPTFLSELRPEPTRAVIISGTENFERQIQIQAGRSVLTGMTSNKAAITDTKLTTTDLMQKLRLSRKTICTWVRTGKLRAVPMPEGT